MFAIMPDTIVYEPLSLELVVERHADEIPSPDLRRAPGAPSNGNQTGGGIRDARRFCVSIRQVLVQ